jgi:hypothetical protein
VGLDGGVTSVDYDDEQRNPNYISSNIHFVVSGKRARSEFDINLGATNINRDRFENQSGFTGNLSWLVRLTGHSQVRTYIASELQEARAQLNYPVTALLSSGVAVAYNRIKRTDDNRTDERYEVGGDIDYQPSRKLRSVLDLRYRKKDSTLMNTVK